MQLQNVNKVVFKKIKCLLHQKYCPIYLPWFYRSDERIVFLKYIELKRARKFRYDSGYRGVEIFFEAFWWPVCTLLHTFKNCFGLNGKYLKSNYDIGFFKQFMAQLILSQRYNIHPKNFYEHFLFLPDNWENRSKYFFHPLFSGLLEEINDGADISRLSDKLLFRTHCKQYEIPTIEIYAKIYRNKIEWLNDKIINRHLPEEDLFIKPVDSKFKPYGSGAELWRFNDGVWYRNDTKYTYPQLIEHFCELSTELEYIVMPRIKNNRLVGSFTNGALSTIRIVTIYTPTGIKVIESLLRLPIDDMDVDNCGAGGMFAPIDPAGVIGKGVFIQLSHGEHLYHPNTGVQFYNKKYPKFEDCIELCTKAHLTMPDIKSIGWDVAYTEEGIIVVEGNNNWGIPLDPPLWRSGFLEWAHSELKRSNNLSLINSNNLF